jgi:hypothetical protein
VTYLEWYRSHAAKHAEIMATLTHLSDEAVIDYFSYENMRQHHPDFCPLYLRNIKCHDIEALNCYLCGCMHFRFDDSGMERVGQKVRLSDCAIASEYRATFETETSLHNDCSGCTIPHRKAVIQNYFDRDWDEMMRETCVNAK